MRGYLCPSALFNTTTNCTAAANYSFVTPTNAQALVVDYLSLLSIYYFDVLYSVHLDYSFMIATNKKFNQDAGNKECQNKFLYLVNHAF